MLLTVQQKEMAHTTCAILGYLGKGATTLIEIVAKAAANTAVKGLGLG